LRELHTRIVIPRVSPPLTLDEVVGEPRDHRRRDGSNPLLVVTRHALDLLVEDRYVDRFLGAMGDEPSLEDEDELGGISGDRLVRPWVTLDNGIGDFLETYRPRHPIQVAAEPVGERG